MMKYNSEGSRAGMEVDNLESSFEGLAALFWRVSIGNWYALGLQCSRGGNYRLHVV